MVTEVETGASSPVPLPGPKGVRDPEARGPTRAEIPREVKAALRAHLTSPEMKDREGLLETIAVLPDFPVAHPRVHKTETAVHPPPDVAPNPTTTFREVTVAPRVRVTSHEMTMVLGILPETIAVLLGPAVTRPLVPETETAVHPLPDVVPNTTTTPRCDARAVATKKGFKADQNFPEASVTLPGDLIAPKFSLNTNVCTVPRTS